MGSCYANFGLRKYFGGVPKFPLRDVIENTRGVNLVYPRKIACAALDRQ